MVRNLWSIIYGELFPFLFAWFIRFATILQFMISRPQHVNTIETAVWIQIHNLWAISCRLAQCFLYKWVIEIMGRWCTIFTVGEFCGELVRGSYFPMSKTHTGEDFCLKCLTFHFPFRSPSRSARGMCHVRLFITLDLRYESEIVTVIFHYNRKRWKTLLNRNLRISWLNGHSRSLKVIWKTTECQISGQA